MADAAWRFEGDGIRVFEAPPETVLVLRLWRPDAAIRATLAQQAWPTAPNSVSASGEGCRVAWVAPGEWLLMGRDAAAIAACATAALDGTPHHLSDVSAATFRVDVEGANARRLLAKACSLDLHRRAFGQGSCARSVFAQLPVLVMRVAEDGFELHFDVSWRDYVLTWLRQAVQDIAS